MLQAMHDRITGWIAWIIVGALVLVFALWGIDSYIKSEAKVYAAQVNGVEISVPEFQRALENQRQRLRQALGDNYDSIVNSKELRKRVLDQLIEQELLVQAANRAGMTISRPLLAARIRSIDAFQEKGKFSEARYQQLLSRQGMPIPVFEAQMRRSMLINQLAAGIVDTASVSDYGLNRIYALQDQERKLAYLVIPSDRFKSQVKVSDAEIAAYYKQHQSEFMAPAKVQLAYLELDINEIAAQEKVSEDALKEAYKNQQSQFVTQAQRQVRHILIAVPKDADKKEVDKAHRKAEDILKKLHDGASFAALAKKYSDDPGSADKGGDLGWIQQGEMVAPFDKAAFSLKKDQISGLVRTRYGFHIIEVTGIRPSHQQSFADVRSQLAEQLRRQKAENDFYDKQQKLANLTFEHPDTLEPAAKALGLTIKHTDWITRDQGSGIAKDAKIRAAAFGHSVLNGGNNSDPITLGKNHLVVLRDDKSEPAKQLTLEQVHDKIAAQLKAQKEQQRAREEGEAMVAKLRKGTSLDDIAKQLNLKVMDPGFIKRGDAQDPDAIVRKAFELPHPAAGGSSVAGLGMGSKGYALVEVSEVKDGNSKKLSKKDRTDLRKSVDSFYGKMEFNALIAELKKNAKIDIPKGGGDQG
ncbi:MAG: SurA N-terminal domain-containing protein [Gammaproteobacteria bacterium]|jgi:peptidyl-prolyl cis-trans isomerase D